MKWSISSQAKYSENWWSFDIHIIELNASDLKKYIDQSGVCNAEKSETIALSHHCPVKLYF